MKVPVKICYRLWFEHEGGYVLGGGAFALLHGVDELGSLKKAAEELGMPYRGAWGRIRKAESALGIPLLVRTKYRQHGVSLTPEAKSILALFHSIDRSLGEQIAQIIQENTSSCVEITAVGT